MTFPKSLDPWADIIKEYSRTQNLETGETLYEVRLAPGRISSMGYHKMTAPTLYILRRKLSYEVRRCSCDACDANLKNLAR